MKTPTKTILAALTAAIFAESLAADVVRCITEPVADVEMSSIVPGKVAAIHFGEGRFVEKGAVVMELESRSEQLDIDRRNVLVGNLKATLERSEMLLEKTTAISMEEVDKARSEYRIAEIELALARDAFDKKLIRAPIAGVVTYVPVEVGEYTEPPQVVVRIVDIRSFYCVANIDPVTAARLKSGDPVIYISDSGFGTQKLAGQIVFISPVVDPASGLLRIKAQFANPDGKVRPGEAGLLELSPES